MTGASLERGMLEALGAGKPLWRRRWVAEECLASKKDHDEVAEVLERLARAPGILLHLRVTPHGRYWLLEHASDVLTEVSDESDDTDEDASAVTETKPGLRARLSASRTFPIPAKPASFLGSREISNAGAATSDAPPAQTPSVPQQVTTSQVSRVLRNLGFTVEDIDQSVQVGPTLRRYRMLLGPGTRIEAVRRRIEDISRELGCQTGALISNLPGERYMALDLPRADREMVPLAPALDLLPDNERAASMWLALGVTPAGQRVTLDLVDVPHLLVAGAPGAGKTIFIQAAVLSLVHHMSPDDVEIVIIDPKGVDFVPFAALPHVRGGRVITAPEEAIETLSEITTDELPERTRILQASESSNLRDLRRRSTGPRYLVVVIDEFAELVTILGRSERAAFETEVLRLAQRARAVGIHLIIATQRPTTDLITGAIKANLPSRISFRLPQRIDSQVILDQPGAENLLGAGDMLFLHAGKMQRLQGYFAPMNQVADLVAARAMSLKKTVEPTNGRSQ